MSTSIMSGKSGVAVANRFPVTAAFALLASL